jgi:hypothetical protein
MRHTFSKRLCQLAGIAILSASAALARQAPPPANAPVPPILLTAKKVFISNAGSDSGLFPHPFSGDPDRAYNQFYTAISAGDHFEVVGDPAEADLVFELQLTSPSGPQSPNKQNGASDPLPMFRLIIFDRTTHYILWALTESIDPAFQQKTHDHNFDQALAALVSDLKRVTTKSSSQTP